MTEMITSASSWREALLNSTAKFLAVSVPAVCSFVVFAKIFNGAMPSRESVFIYAGLPCLAAGILTGLLFSKRRYTIPLCGAGGPGMLAFLFFSAWRENRKPLADLLHVLTLPAIIFGAFLAGWMIAVVVKATLLTSRKRLGEPGVGR